jgi:PAS domain S-box-containing protein
MKQPIRILHLEDSPYDAELIQNLLEAAGISSTVVRVDNETNFLGELEKDYDLILSDYSLPSFDGLAALSHAQQKAPDVPFVFISAAMGEERAIDSLKRGATDYVLKQRLSRLAHVVRRALQEKEERLRRRRVEEALQESEQKLRSIIETSPDWIWETDAEGRITFSNGAIEAIIGYPPAALMGKPIFSYLHQDDASAFAAELPVFVREKRGWRGKLLRWLHRNGDYRWLESNALPIFNTPGDVVGFRGVDRDITERIRAEESLRLSEERFRLITENTKDLIALLTLDARRLYVSPSYGALLDNPDALVGTNAFTEIHPDDRTRIEEAFAKMVTTGKDLRAEYRLIDKRGIVRFIEAHGNIIRDRNGNPMNAVIVSRDVTERKQLEEQLLHVQKMESIGTLAGGIAHDFNNVLAILLGYASMLSKEPMQGESVVKAAQAMITAIQRGAGLVRQLLTFARKSEAAFEPVSLNAVAEEVVEMCKHTFRKTITITTQLAEDLPNIIADRNQLHQALLNLCVNARDAIQDAGTISLTSGIVDAESLGSRIQEPVSQRYVRLSITDTGSGMDAATRARIFEPFFTTKEKGRGTGLGLAMVYGVVKAHQGCIDVESEPGKGTTFHLYFPIPLPGSKSLVTETEPTEKAAGGGETILLAEDEPALLELVKAVLEERGYRVVPARDGVEALELFKKHVSSIDLVLTDLGLPKLSGWEAFLKMREIQPNVAAVVATGYVDPDQRSEMLTKGVRDFVDKPYAPHQLLKKIRAVLDGLKL